MTQLLKFLNQHPIGMIIRTFASDPDRVADRAEMVIKVIKKALDVRVFEGKSVFKHIDILIPMDPKYPHDCLIDPENPQNGGQTMPYLKERIKNDPVMWGKVSVTEVYRGELYCEVLNRGIGIQLKRRIHYSCIISPEAHSYMNLDTMVAVLDKAAAGSLATGVAIDELTESVLAGKLANTFCLWDNIALIQAGCFNLTAALPVDDKTANCYVTRDSESGKLVYNKAMGVEEIIPLLYMVRSNNGKACIAAVRPQGEGVKLYQPPPAGPELDRHNAKMNSKAERQNMMATSINCDIVILKGALIAA